MQKHFYKKIIIWFFTAVIVIFISYLVSSRIRSKVSNDAITSPINVNVIMVNKTTAPIYIEAIGALFANKRVDISPQIAGQIKEVQFQYGETVKEGQSLYQLDSSLYQAQLQKAQSDLAFNKMAYQRFLKLAKTGAIAKQAYDKSLTDYQDAKSKFNVLSVDLEKTEITAPFSGVINASQVDVGQYVRVGESLATLVDKSNLTVRFSVSEDDLSKITKGQLVTIQTDNNTNPNFHGKVSYMAPSVDPDTRTVTVWADVPNPDNQLAPGLFVHVKLMIGSKEDTLLIPQEALIPTVEGNDVFVIQNGRAYQKSVAIGQRINNDVVIRKGLKAGEEVVIEGQEKLINGRLVSVLSR